MPDLASKEKAILKERNDLSERLKRNEANIAKLLAKKNAEHIVDPGKLPSATSTLRKMSEEELARLTNEERRLVEAATKKRTPDPSPETNGVITPEEEQASKERRKRIKEKIGKVLKSDSLKNLGSTIRQRLATKANQALEKKTAKEAAETLGSAETEVSGKKESDRLKRVASGAIEVSKKLADKIKPEQRPSIAELVNRPGARNAFTREEGDHLETLDKKERKLRKIEDPIAPPTAAEPSMPAVPDSTTYNKEMVRTLVDTEIMDFLTEFGIEAESTGEFKYLSPADALKVVRDTKRRVVDIVKSDAQTQYSEGFKEKPFIKSIWSSLATKKSDLKNIEKDVFDKLKNSPEGRELILKNISVLSKNKAGKDVILATAMNAEGKPIVTNPFVLYLLQDPGSSEEEQRITHAFNEAANKLGQIPYEWGQEKSGKNKKRYMEAVDRYEEARAETLKILAAKETPERTGESMLELMQIDNAIRSEQVLSTHPEFQETLEGFREEAGGKEYVQNAGNFLNTMTGGKNWTNKLLFAGGFGARMATVSLLGAAGAPVVGGVLGGLRARFRAKDTLVENKKQARQGKKDVGEEKARMVDAPLLANGLQKMIAQTESAGNAEERAKILSKLAVLISHTQNQIEQGQVNFGDAKSVLENQFNLVENLNKALVMRSVEELDRELQRKIYDSITKFVVGYERTTTGGEINAEGVREIIETNKFIKGKDQQIYEAQASFIKKQMLRGALLGAGAATAGYALRYVGEQLGWWGHHAAEVKNVAAKPDAGEGFMKRAEDWIKKILEHKQDISNKQVPTAGIKPAQSVAESYNMPKVVPPPENNPDSFDSINFSKTIPKSDFDSINFSKALHHVETTPAPGALAQTPSPEHFEVNPDAIVHKGEGIENTFIRQIEHNKELATNLGWDGKEDLHHFAQGEAHRLAIQEGYVDGPNEIRVVGADKVAYEIKMEDGHPTVLEKNVELDNKIIETHHIGDKFETDTEKYEYKYSPEGKMTTPAVSESKIDMMPNREQTLRGQLEKQYQTITDSNKANEAVKLSSLALGGLITGAAYRKGDPKTFSKLSEKEIYTLRNHSEYADNPFGLPAEKVIEAYNTNRSNGDLLFGSHESLIWKEAQKARAEAVLAGRGDERAVRYIKLLASFSSLKPKSSGLFRRAESTEKYVARALQKIISENKLELFEENLRK